MADYIQRLLGGAYTDEDRARFVQSFLTLAEQMEMAMPEMRNPYWDAVKDHVSLDNHRGTPCVGNIFDLIKDGKFDLGIQLRKEELIVTHSFTITDPLTVAFVAQYAKKLIDPMCGTAYWGYLLDQYGCDVINYDENPGDNMWHNGLWAPCWKMDGVESVKKHPDRTLLLSWPPRGNTGYKILKAYEGKRVIHIGERGGCTGSRALDHLLDDEWELVASHLPVQWHMVKDYVEVYERD